MLAHDPRSPIFLVMLALIGCGDNSVGGETGTMEPYVAAIDDLIVDIREIGDAHRDALEMVASVEDAVAETDAYVVLIETHHELMHHEIDDMQHCDEDGAPPHTDGLATVIEGLDGELVLHGENVAAAADVTAVTDEATRHADKLTEILDGADEESAHLSAEAASIMCPVREAHTDMHHAQ